MISAQELNMLMQMFQVAKFLSLRFVPADLTDHIKEIWGTSEGSTFLFHMSGEVVGKDFDHGLRCKLVHGVVLVVASGEISKHVPGEFVDALDDLGHVGLEVCRGEEVLKLREVLIGNLTLPLKLATALFNHSAETRVFIHVLLEGLRESLGSNLTDVHSKHDEVEVTLDVVHDLGLEICLPVIRGDIKGHLRLNNALSDILNTSAAWRRSGKINKFINLGFGNLGSGEGIKKFFDDFKFSHLHSVAVFLDFNIDAGKSQLLLLKSIKNVIRDDTPHSVQFSGQLELLDEGSADNGGGGAADSCLAVEDDWARGGGVLEHGDNLVKVGFLGSLLLVHGDADWLQLGDLVLDGSIDLIEGGDSASFSDSSSLEALSSGCSPN